MADNRLLLRFLGKRFVVFSSLSFFGAVFGGVVDYWFAVVIQLFLFRWGFCRHGSHRWRSRVRTSRWSSARSCSVWERCARSLCSCKATDPAWRKSKLHRAYVPRRSCASCHATTGRASPPTRRSSSIPKSAPKRRCISPTWSSFSPRSCKRWCLASPCSTCPGLTACWPRAYSSCPASCSSASTCTSGTSPSATPRSGPRA